MTEISFGGHVNGKLKRANWFINHRIHYSPLGTAPRFDILLSKRSDFCFKLPLRDDMLVEAERVNDTDVNFNF